MRWAGSTLRSDVKTGTERLEFHMVFCLRVELADIAADDAVPNGAPCRRHLRRGLFAGFLKAGRRRFRQGDPGAVQQGDRARRAVCAGRPATWPPSTAPRPVIAGSRISPSPDTTTALSRISQSARKAALRLMTGIWRLSSPARVNTGSTPITSRHCALIRIPKTCATGMRIPNAGPSRAAIIGTSLRTGRPWLMAGRPPIISLYAAPSSKSCPTDCAAMRR